jgi:nitrate/nitrite-specific signal transduction histidine kinase
MSDEAGHETRRATGQELALILDRAQFLLEILRSSEAAPSAAEGARVAALEEEVRDLEGRVAHAERQHDRLMRLYVATYQLHATLDPKEVLGNISEIVVNLVGADRFVLILTDPAGGPGAIVSRHGFDEELSDRSLIRFAGRTYGGGDPLVDGALVDGRLCLGGEGTGSPVIAAVPLNVNGRTVGALTLLRLLGHRRDLEPDDREMLDLLAAHAASALFAAQSCATAEHKLRKLAGILGPARRSA